MYMYRLNRKERIIFNIEKDKRIIYDIVSVNDTAKAHAQKSTFDQNFTTSKIKRLGENGDVPICSKS